MVELNLVLQTPGSRRKVIDELVARVPKLPEQAAGQC
jgi:hypothetical protein